MMQRVMYTGSDAILTAFDMMSEDTPYYSVWIGKMIMASNNTDDAEKGRKKVEQMIIACEQSQNTDMITIKFHPSPDKAGFITDKTPVCASMTVRATSIEGNADQLERLNNTQYSFMLNSITKAIDEKITPLHEKIIALESAEVDEAEPEDGIIGAINKFSPLLNNPVIMGLIEKYVAPFITGQQQPKPQMIAGTPAAAAAGSAPQPQLLNDEDLTKLNNALNRLAAHCDLVKDISLLADFADNNTMMFKGLIKNLRS
jgi:hypothetical protein